MTSTDPVPAQADVGTEPQPVLTDVWEGDDGAGFDAESSNVKICRNACHFTFDGFAEGDEDIATSWRKLLDREGKSSPHGTSVRDLVLGPTSEAEPAGEAGARAARERSEQEREMTGIAARSHTQPRVLSSD